MNVFFIIAIAGLGLFCFLFIREMGKPKKSALTRQQMKISPIPDGQNMPQNANLRLPKQDYRQAIHQASKDFNQKKAEEAKTHPQAIPHSTHREAHMTVDTNFEQAKTKMWGLSPLKQPINPEEYDMKKDAFMYWKRRIGQIYFLLAICSFFLFLLMGS